MNRPLPTLLITIALAGWGIYRALYLPGMLVGTISPLLLIGFLLQAVFGIAGAVGVWSRAQWAPLVIVLLGLSIAGTALVEAFVFGIMPYLRALLEALMGIVVTLLVAAYVRTSRQGNLT